MSLIYFILLFILYTVSQEICIDTYLGIGIILRTEDIPRQIKENAYSLGVPTLLTLHYFLYFCENELHCH